MLIKFRQWLVFIILVSLDQLSKFFVQYYFNFKLNPGLSWSLLADYQFNLILTAILSFGLIIGYRWFKTQFWGNDWLFIIFISGVVGNLIDRWLFGGVRDWLNWGGFSNNLADIYLTLAIAGWLIYLIYSIFYQYVQN